ncbi:MAG: transcriptional repressor LexA [Miltoncostaeaceae bacterium]
MDGISERQAAILEFIGAHCRNNGYPPTVREIGLGVGLASPSTVHAHLAKLEASGHIKRDPTKPRAMFICSNEQSDDEPQRIESNALPVLGAVAAGVPTLAEEHVEDHVTSPFPGDFMLRVKGDSMIDAGILEEDLVVVRRQQTADHGEIVVALIEDEATVKRLDVAGERPFLMPENESYEPIPADDARVLGVVVGVLRAL